MNSLQCTVRNVPPASGSGQARNTWSSSAKKSRQSVGVISMKYLRGVGWLSVWLFIGYLLLFQCIKWAWPLLSCGHVWKVPSLKPNHCACDNLQNYKQLNKWYLVRAHTYTIIYNKTSHTSTGSARNRDQLRNLNQQLIMSSTQPKKRKRNARGRGAFPTNVLPIDFPSYF